MASSWTILDTLKSIGDWTHPPLRYYDVHGWGVTWAFKVLKVPQMISVCRQNGKVAVLKEFSTFGRQRGESR